MSVVEAMLPPGRRLKEERSAASKLSGEMEEANTPGEMERSLSHNGRIGDAGKGPEAYLGQKLQGKFKKSIRSPCRGGRIGLYRKSR